MAFLKILNIYRAMHVSLIQNDSQKCLERNEQSPEKTKKNGEHKKPY